MKHLGKKLAAATLLAAGLAFGSVAQALPISGTFQLVSDGLGQGGPAGTVNLQGSFTTENAVTGTLMLGGVTYDTLGLDIFTVVSVDPLPGLGSFDISDPAVTVAAPLLALLSGVGPDYTVVGFQGGLLRVADATSLTFTGPDSVMAGGFGGTAPFANLSLSGVTLVPEPNGVALLGAGLLAFGFARRRRLQQA